MNETLKQARASALVLFAFALLATALMAAVYALTRDTVRQNEENARLALLSQTLPAGSYDNNPARDAIMLAPAQSKALGNDDASHVYPARRDGRTVALVFEATAPNGYAGKIRLLVGVLRDGSVSGVRVVAHKETPGLGDYIDSAKSDWVHQFDRQGLDNAGDWRVKKDGGRFDYMAGATITSRAMVAAVANTLAFYRAHPELGR